MIFQKQIKSSKEAFGNVTNESSSSWHVHHKHHTKPLTQKPHIHTSPTLMFPIQSYGIDFLEYQVPKPFPFVFGNMGGTDMGWEQSQTGLNFFWPKSWNFDDFFKERFP